jgi:small multidrug resistance pump
VPAHYLYICVSVIAEAAGFAALNASANFTRPVPSLLMAAAFGISFYFLTLALRTLPLGITYALTSGLGIILVALTGLLIFGQRLDLAAVIGLSLIAAGIVVIHVLSNVAAH